VPPLPPPRAEDPAHRVAAAHGAGQLWSHIPQTQAWQNFQMPFPLICADSRPVGSNLTSRLAPDATVYEVSYLCGMT
jgi:hypothetical protein